MRWWPALWILTSAVLLLFAAQAESGVFAAGVYIGANVIGVGATWLRQPPPSTTVLQRLGIAAALQLPVALYAFVQKEGGTPATSPEPSEEMGPPHGGTDPPT